MCKEELDAMQEALDSYGPFSSQYRAALGRYLQCYEHIVQGRASHAAAWDERLYLLHKELQQAWEQLMKGVPPRPTCGGTSSEARSKIFATKETAMIFSKKLEEAFNKTGVTLDEDETYACFVCVVKKPQYVSEALALDPLGQKVGGMPRVNYIMEPAIMESVMSTLEQDTIKYESRVRR